MIDDFDNIKIAILAGIGATVAFGKVLVSDEPWSWRKTAGRVIIGGAVGMTSASLLNFFPNLPYEALIGICCALSIMGADAIQALVSKFLK